MISTTVIQHHMKKNLHHKHPLKETIQIIVSLKVTQQHMKEVFKVKQQLRHHKNGSSICDVAISAISLDMFGQPVHKQGFYQDNHYNSSKGVVIKGSNSEKETLDSLGDGEIKEGFKDESIQVN